MRKTVTEFKTPTAAVNLIKKPALQEMKRQATDQEKIIPNHISCKGFNSRKYREFSKLNNETNTQLKNGQDILINT